MEPGIPISKKPVIALSGFKFPFFPYTEKTLVQITDKTDYQEYFLNFSHDKNTYNQRDFDHDLYPEVLEIEVEEFAVMFAPNTFKKLGSKKPPVGWADFHEEVHWMKEEGEDLIWPMTKPIHKQLVLLGMLEQLPETQESRELYFHSFTAKKLKEICERLELKKTGTKNDVVKRIITHGKPTARLSVSITDKYFITVEKLAKAYLADIKKQLNDKPKAYAVAIWEQVSEEYGLGEQLPKGARKLAKKLLKSVT